MVFLHIVPESLRKVYDLVAVDGTTISEKHVLFLKDWSDLRARDLKNTEMRREFITEMSLIDRIYACRLAT